MVIEECAELIQAINKVRRASLVTDLEIIKPDENMSVKDCLIYGELCGEIADVKIMISQIELIIGSETINFLEERKLKKLHNRL